MLSVVMLSVVASPGEIPCNDGKVFKDPYFDLVMISYRTIS
jgi:hypothetical protein